MFLLETSGNIFVFLIPIFFLSLALSPGYSTTEEGEAILPPWLDKHEDKSFPVWMIEQNDRRGSDSLPSDFLICEENKMLL